MTNRKPNGWLLIATMIAVVTALQIVSLRDKPKPVKQTDPAKERRVVTIIKWLWEKD